MTRDNILDFHVTGDNWVLEVGQLYTFTVQLFDHKNNHIFMSEVCGWIHVVHNYVCVLHFHGRSV